MIPNFWCSLEVAAAKLHCWAKNERAENEIAVFSLSYAEICNAIRSCEKRKASKKKKGKDLAVLTKTPRDWIAFSTGWHKKNGHHQKSTNFQNFI